MNDLQLPIETELKLRMLQHRYAILGAKLHEDFMKQQTNGISIPEFMLGQQAMDYVSKKISEYMQDGVFIKEYEKAYESLKDRLPDNYSTLL